MDAKIQAVFCIDRDAGVCDLLQAVREVRQIRQMLSDVFQDLEMKKTNLLELWRVSGVLGVVFVNSLVQRVAVMPIIFCNNTEIIMKTGPISNSVPGSGPWHGS